VGDLSWSTAGGGDSLPHILDKLVAFGNSENPVSWNSTGTQAKWIIIYGA
jgi:hypothetical protein